MGLDMYLTANKYLGSAKDEKLKKAIQKSLDIMEFEPSQIEFEIGYWRKANQIHKWFVKNVQDRKDDCGTYYVSQEKIQELLKAVNLALQSETPNKILPTQSGFFFGDTGYDEGYIDDLKHTKKVIEKFMNWKGKDEVDLQYHSSW